MTSTGINNIEDSPLLEVQKINSGYGFLQILWDVTISLRKGEFVGLIGSNGVGKSTLLKSIFGVLEIKSGEIILRGKSIKGLPSHEICKLGVSYVSEELNLFQGMSVRENLLMGAYTIQEKKEINDLLGFVYELFPRLKERDNQLAGTLSGGERKMAAIARSLMSSPEILLIDEPSLGLAPQVVEGVFLTLDALRKKGLTILLVEQNVKKTLKTVDRGYVMEKGRVVLEGTSDFLTGNEYVRKAYLGI